MSCYHLNLVNLREFQSGSWFGNKIMISPCFYLASLYFLMLQLFANLYNMQLGAVTWVISGAIMVTNSSTVISSIMPWSRRWSRSQNRGQEQRR